MSFRIDQLAVLNLATVGNSITAGSFVKSGGTSSQFLKADGSVDSSVYITGITSGMVTTALGYTPVPNTRNLTINGTTYDLSADRSWTISAGVSSVTGSGSGISVSPTTGAVVVSNTGVTSNVAGTGISVSGATGAVTITNTGVTSVTAGTGISVSASTGAVTITNAGVTSVNGSTGAITGIITTSNYNSYSPTLTGGGASGTWGISVTGSAGSASTASLVNATSGGAIQSYDIRTISPSSMTAYRMGFGFTSWANNNTAPWADYLHLRSYSDASGGSDNLITFLKSGIGMRIWQQSFGSATAYSSYKDIAFTDGTNASGTWGINITGTAASETLATVTGRGNSTGSNIITSANMYAEAFYDYSNNGYYLNPAGTSNLYRGIFNYVLTVGSGVYMDWWNDGSGTYMEFVGNSTATRKLRLQGPDASNVYSQWFIDAGNQQIYGTVAGNTNFLFNSSTVYLRYNGSDKFWTGSDGTRNAGWLYMQNTGAGIHYPSYNSHFYMSGGAYWHINPTGGSSYGGLILYSDYNGTTGGSSYRKGYLYYDTNGFGLLGGGDGSWAININSSTSKYVTIGGDQSTQAYSAITGVRLMFGGGNSDAQGNYYIGTNLDNYGGNYNKLDLAWHTGIRLGAQPGYGGIRMYDSEDFGTVIFSVGTGDANVRVTNNLYMGGNLVATQSWVNSQGFATGGPFIPVSGGVNMTGSYGLNDNRLYLRTNGDTNHYLWNAGDDWEELGAYAGTGFRVTSNNGANGLLYVYGSSNGGYTYSPYSFRAPIFYDSDNTSYYCDPASTSVLNTISSYTIYNTSLGSGYYFTAGSWGWKHQTPSGYIEFGPANTSYAHIYTDRGNFYFNVDYMYQNGNRMLAENIWINSKYFSSGGEIYATRLYDSNDSTYYVDPHSTSNLYKLSEFTMCYNDMNAMSANSPYASRYSGSANYRNGTMGYGTTDFNVMFSNWGSGFIDSWSSPANAPNGSASHWVGLQTFHYNHQNSSQAYGWQMIYGGGAGDRWYLRQGWPNAGGWVEMIHTGNIASQSVSYASSAGNADTVDGYHGSNYIGKNGNTYYQPDTWIQLNGYYGLYAPSYNSAHFYANNGSYGAWRIAGSRNGWGGIEFDRAHQVCLMVNHNEVGFYNTSYGWMLDWYQGTLYTSTGTYGGSMATVLHSSNYNSYSPTLTGGGASGTWGISITGSAGSATSATYLNTSNYIQQTGSTGSWNADFQNTPAGTLRHGGDVGANTTNNPGGSWWMQQNFRHTNSSNYWGIQVAWGWEDNANRLATRNVIGGSFGGWVYYLNSANYTSYAIARGGDTVTGVIYYQSNLGPYSGSLSGPPLQAYSTGNNSAFMSFHKGGYYAVNMGLDTDNVLRIGGWSASSNRWQLDMSGNMTVAGDVTAYSDARVKENVITVEDALDKVLSLRGVYYNRTDSEDKRRKVGVIAQEIMEVIPEVVGQDNDGMYNVSYGNIVGVLIEAMKEQQKQIDELKAKLDGTSK